MSIWQSDLAAETVSPLRRTGFTLVQPEDGDTVSLLPDHTVKMLPASDRLRWEPE